MRKICKKEASNVAVFMPHPVKKSIWLEDYMMRSMTGFLSGVLILLYSANPAYLLRQYRITSLYL